MKKMSDVTPAEQAVLDLLEDGQRYKLALEEIRDVARVSEGVEFYAMLAQKALDGE
jgi:hypothetical protein